MPFNEALAATRAATYTDEAALIARLLQLDQRSPDTIASAQRLAAELILRCRDNDDERSLLDSFLTQFGLSTEEGVALMCLAESVIRVPDAQTADDLIADKLGSTRWKEHIGQSESLLVNASTWALMLTGEVIELGKPVELNFQGWLGQLVNRVGEPIIRQSLRYAIRLLGNEFVFATNIRGAVEKADRDTLYSFDMLGEAARTETDAKAYMDAYSRAIDTVGNSATGPDCFHRSGISVKLSALHPRYQTRQRETVFSDLYPRLLQLAEAAARFDIQLTIDAEEANRLELSLELFASLCAEPALRSWQGLGLAVQAYGKRALPVLEYLRGLSDQHNRRVIVRLVKGAYWDSEIKHAQVHGLPGYPVFTAKPATDLSYLVCAQYLNANSAHFYSQFATHNAHTLANVLALSSESTPADADKPSAFELQRLHGMGELLYDQARKSVANLPPVRTYAPVGPHDHLMAYLIRRLLENGANSSFVNRFLDDSVPVDTLVRNIRQLVIEQPGQLPLPRAIFSDRPNSNGTDLNEPAELEALQAGIAPWKAHIWAFNAESRRDTEVRNPARPEETVGHYQRATEADAASAVAEAARAHPHWNALPAAHRADTLRRTADAYERETHELVALLVREAGKTLDDAIAEIREAVDFCRYYANECERLFAEPNDMPGPTGESNRLYLQGRGVFVCISPWNFPLAIFTGQITAALAAGNTVVAKPASQTPLIALRAVELMHQAGVPGEVLQLLPGGGSVGAAAVANPDIDGVVFTGSTSTAKHIHRSLADKPGPIAPLIAETGGQNAMIVDSTAMVEQVVDDAIESAFASAGQRCSAVRILCVQKDVADTVLKMLTGAIDQLKTGDPWEPSTDVGPIIDSDALAALNDHVASRSAGLLTSGPSPKDANGGYFLPPQLIELDRFTDLKEEHFGPVLHVVRYRRSQLDQLLNDLASLDFALTLGIHSRNNQFIDHVFRHTHAGNVYVNRNTIGAVVGVQPFGGQRLSGTGPKAGGPHYVARFATERTLTNNVTAIGGNLALLTEARGD